MVTDQGYLQIFCDQNFEKDYFVALVIPPPNQFISDSQFPIQATEVATIRRQQLSYKIYLKTNLDF